MQRRGLVPFAIAAGLRDARASGGEVVVTAGSGHNDFEVPALAIAAPVNRSGSSASGWLVGGIVVFAVLVLVAVGIIAARRSRGTVAKA